MPTARRRPGAVARSISPIWRLVQLVESPVDINHYLESYLATDGYTIRGDLADEVGAPNTTRPRSPPCYDFLTDQAMRYQQPFSDYGFRYSGQFVLTYTNDTLINDSWDVNNLTSQWFFPNQLPQLTASYNGPQTKFHLMSINAHFSHHDAIPADDKNGTLLAERLLTPTVALGNPQAAYFATATPDYGDSASLACSVGCHSGLSVIANDIHGNAASKYRADFAEAMLKQGGNWIGNTGYGYGDSDLVAYSERLSLLFTEAIGRDIRNNFTYIGLTVGESLARAKREYIRNDRARRLERLR